MTTRRKLIEVALPLEAINKAAAREKSIRHGHPSTLHLWWARRPLAAARAVIFAQMVDDPSGYADELLADDSKRRAASAELVVRQEAWRQQRAEYEKARARGETSVKEPGLHPTLEECAAGIERERVFRLIEELVQWESTINERVLAEAREEIWKSWRRACADNKEHPRAQELFDPDRLPGFHDPFAGGGALPLEAQRLGLESYASDLNPVAVLINKAMIEIPPRFAERAPVNPASRRDKKLIQQNWRGAQGLAEDVRYYGQWMRDEAAKLIGHLYPPIEITVHMAKDRADLAPLVGKKVTAIAWLWARTVKSPNPAFVDVDVPLASTFMVCTKPGREVYVEPVIEDSGYRFEVRLGSSRDSQVAAGTKLARGANFRCLMSGVPIEPRHIYGEANAGRMGSRLMAIVADSDQGRVYLSPTRVHEDTANAARPVWKPDLAMPENPRWFSPPLYGLKTYGDLFTPRQLVALTAFSDLVEETRKEVLRDAVAAGFASDGRCLDSGGQGAQAYADALAVYLAFCVDKGSLTNTTQATWQKDPDRLTQGFARQAIPMTWDFAEANPLSEAGGGIGITASAVAKVLERLPGKSRPGTALQRDAGGESTLVQWPLISTDPPYYDNIGYADLSDYFYVWLRRSLKPVFSTLFSTMAVPKAEELVATPYRHGTKEKAEAFFLHGMTRAMNHLAARTHPGFPVTIYYAFKQSENSEEGTSSTGWDTFLEAVIQAGFALSGTWPMRTELLGSLKKSINALASSIVLVCRPREADAPTATRRDFVAALKRELPAAVAHLQRGNIAPVDLAQSAIGPGMSVFTRYSRVLDNKGEPMRVREALALINETLDEVLAEQEGDFDADSRFALVWFDQHAFAEGEFGVADVLSRAKNTSVQGMEDAGILVQKSGKVRLFKPSELPADWDPTTDARLTAWEAVHHLVRALESGGEEAAADLARHLGSKAEAARELAYRLYALCERKKRALEALSYNALVQSWPEIVRRAGETRTPTGTQTEFI